MIRLWKKSMAMHKSKVKTTWFWHVKQFCLLELITQSIFNQFGQIWYQSLNLRFLFPTSYNLVIYFFSSPNSTFSNFLTHRARETPYGACNCLLRIPDIPIWCLCIVALNPGYPHMALRILQQKPTICGLIG